MSGLWKEILTIYGPLGLGWPLAMYFVFAWQKDRKERDKYHREDLKSAIEQVSGVTVALVNVEKILSIVAERVNNRRGGDR